MLIKGIIMRVNNVELFEDKSNFFLGQVRMLTCVIVYWLFVLKILIALVKKKTW